MDFIFLKKRFVESTHVRTLTLARRVERARKQSLEENRTGLKPIAAPQFFSAAAEEFMKNRSKAVTVGTLG